MKLCIDCKYYTIRNIGFWFFPIDSLPQCAHPSVISLVDGKPTSYCSTQREYESCECGPEARLFEPKETK